MYGDNSFGISSLTLEVFLELVADVAFNIV